MDREEVDADWIFERFMNVLTLAPGVRVRCVTAGRDTFSFQLCKPDEPVQSRYLRWDIGTWGLSDDDIDTGIRDGIAHLKALGIPRGFLLAAQPVPDAVEVVADAVAARVNDELKARGERIVELLQQLSDLRNAMRQAMSFLQAVEPMDL